jgi:hypothetical protein
MKSFLIKALPHAVAIVVFIVLSTLFFKPLTEGYSLHQSDQTTAAGGTVAIGNYRYVNNDEVLWADNMFSGMPAYQLSVGFKNQWINQISNFLGLGLQRDIAILFKCMLAFYILALCLRINPWLSIAGAACFGLASLNIIYINAGHNNKILALSYMPAVLGGFILALRGKWLLGSAIFCLFLALQIRANHFQMTYYLLILLALVGVTEGIKLIINKNFAYLIKSGIALGVGGVIALLTCSGNLMVTEEYSQYTIRGKKELSIGPDGKPLESNTDSGLNLNYILEYNYASGEQLSLFIPNAKGGKTGQLGKDKQLLKTVPSELREIVGGQNQYWGDQSYTAGAIYIGAAVMFLFLLSFIVLKDWLKWPFLFMTLLCLGLCLQELTGLNDFFIYKFPMYAKFRDTKMILSLIQIMAPISALMLIDQLIKSEFTAKTKKIFLIGLGSASVIALVVCVAPKVSGSFFSKNEVEQFHSYETQMNGDSKQLSQLEDVKEALANVRVEIYKSDAQRSLILVLLTGVVIALLAFKKLPWWAATLALGVIMVGDIWSVDLRYVNEDKVKGQFVNYEKSDSKSFAYPPDACDLAILASEKKKVTNFESKTSELYTALKKIEHYQKIKDDKLLTTFAEFGALNLNSDYRVLLLNQGAFSDASISYLHKSIGGYHGAKLRRYQDLWEFYLSKEIDGITSALKSRNKVSVDSALAASKTINMLNTHYIKYNPEAPPILDSNAMGNAWFVDNLKFVPDANAEIMTLGEIDVKTTAVVDQRFSSVAKSGSGPGVGASVQLTNYASKKITYSSHADNEAAAIFSEVYYPAGWVCRIDGQEKPSFCANYVLRGVMVPAGDHTIEWSFEPASYIKGQTTILIGSVLLVLVILITLFFEIKPLFAKNTVQMK